MPVSFLFALLCFVAVAIIEHSFLSALFGGSLPSNAIVALAAVLLPDFRARTAAVWTAAAALTAEIFSRQSFGAAALGTLIGLVVLRLTLNTIFTHRTVPARIVSGLVALTLAATTTAFARIVSALAGGQTPQSGALRDILLGIGPTLAVSAILFLIFFFLHWLLYRRRAKL